MWQAIGGTLPDALGLALSPIPLVGVILMLTTKSGRPKAVWYTIGWMLAICGVVSVVATAGAAAAEDSSGGTSTWVSVTELLLGPFFLVMAAKQFRERPKDPEHIKPGWMASIDKMSAVGAFVIGGLMIVLNAKNLLLSIAAGSTFGDASLSRGELAFAIVVFTLIASLTMLATVVIAFVAQKRTASGLAKLRDWLLAHNAVIVTVIFLILGVRLLGAGLADLAE